jgi:hypothetical protein
MFKFFALFSSVAMVALAIPAQTQQAAPGLRRQARMTSWSPARKARVRWLVLEAPWHRSAGGSPKRSTIFANTIATEHFCVMAPARSRLIVRINGR